MSKANSPFSGCFKPLYQSEAWCNNHLHENECVNEISFSNEGWALSLAMRKKLKVGKAIFPRFSHYTTCLQGFHGCCIRHLGLYICFDEYNCHNSQQARVIDEKAIE